MNFDGTAVDDIYDITRYVRPVTVRSSLVPWPMEAWTNGKSVFLTAAQVEAVAAVVGAETLYVTGDQAWEEEVPGKGPKILARRYIDGVTYYRFKGHWQFEPAS